MSDDVGTQVAALGGGRPFGAGGLGGVSPPEPSRVGRMPALRAWHPAFFTEKRYVDVYSMTDHEGRVTPLRIVWGDGRSFDVAEIKETDKVKSPFGPTRVVRYTVRIGEHTRWLYFEGAKWFVEAKVPVSARL